MSFTDQRSAVQVLEDALVKKRVLDGIALLEEKYGKDWAKKIDLDMLDLSESRYCVLGQLYNDAPVTEAVAEAFMHSTYGRTNYVADNVEQVHVRLNHSEGYQRGIAILDGPVTASTTGPEWYGFDTMTLWLGDLMHESDAELARLGVTREQVEAARAETLSGDSSALRPESEGLFVGADFGLLTETWKAEIVVRQ